LSLARASEPPARPSRKLVSAIVVLASAVLVVILLFVGVGSSGPEAAGSGHHEPPPTTVDPRVANLPPELQAQAAAAQPAPLEGQRDRAKVEGHIRVPKGSRVLSTGRVLLRNGVTLTGLIRGDGIFVIYDVPPGTYVLEVIAADYTFPLIRVDVSGRDRGKIRGVILPSSAAARAAAASSGEKLAYPFSIQPLFPIEYFQTHVPYNVWGLFKNPMVVMMGLTFLLAVIVPRLMANMDPADVEEIRRMHSQMSLTKMVKQARQVTADPAGGGGGAPTNRVTSGNSNARHRDR